MRKSMFSQGLPAAMAWICGSRKSGPHLNTRTRRPWRRCRRASAAATTVVLPWPEAGAATNAHVEHHGLVRPRQAGQSRFIVPSLRWPVTKTQDWA
jgi:hypothetical protein